MIFPHWLEVVIETGVLWLPILLFVGLALYLARRSVHSANLIYDRAATPSTLAGAEQRSRAIHRHVPKAGR
jgi:hypothetical protein